MNQAVAKTIDHEPEAERLPAVMTPMAMLDRAIEKGAGIDVLEKLMALQERYEKNQARKAFDNAMAAAMAEIPVIIKNREVDFTSTKGRTHYKYEDLAEIVRTVDPILARHGLSKRFLVTSPPNEPVTVTCLVSHRDGHREENTLSAGRDDSGNKNPIQAIGSTLTYLQRMTLKASLGLAASVDDDGRAAGAAEPVGPITPDQVVEINKLIEETGVPVAKLLEYVGAESVETIPAGQYARAIHALGQKKRAAK